MNQKNSKVEFEREPSEENGFNQHHVAVIASSYQQLTGQPMPLCHAVDVNMNMNVGVAQALFEAPFALISHGTEDDPIFNYANRTAMELFNMSWSEITATASRYSAEQVEQAQRAQLLFEVRTKGFIDNYAGIRIAKGGRRFQIEQATVWNLIDRDGRDYGQAAMFSDWRFI